MGENDIMVCVVVKPRFLEDVCLELRADSPLTEFMLDTLRQEVCWNRHLHFTGVDDIAVTDLIKTMLYAAFPYLSNENIRCGSVPEPKLTVYLVDFLATLWRTKKIAFVGLLLLVIFILAAIFADVLASQKMENGVLASSLMNAAKSPSLEHPSAPTPRAAARFTPPPGSASPPTLFRYFFKACV